MREGHNPLPGALLMAMVPFLLPFIAWAIVAVLQVALVLGSLVLPVLVPLALLRAWWRHRRERRAPAASAPAPASPLANTIRPLAIGGRGR